MCVVFLRRDIYIHMDLERKKPFLKKEKEKGSGNKEVAGFFSSSYSTPFCSLCAKSSDSSALFRELGVVVYVLAGGFLVVSFCSCSFFVKPLATEKGIELFFPREEGGLSFFSLPG